MGATVVRVEAVVCAPQAEVFDHVAAHHFDNHPKWDPDVLAMTQTSPGPVGVGTAASVIRRQGKGRVEGTATVTVYEPVRCAAWHVDFGQFQLQQDVELSPEQEGAATRLALRIETVAHGPLKLLLPLMRGRFRDNMERSMAAIVVLLEQASTD